MKAARFDFKVEAGKIDPVKVKMLVESRLGAISREGGQALSVQRMAQANPAAALQPVHVSTKGNGFTLDVDLELLENSFGKLAAVWGMWVEGLLTKEFPELGEIRMDWASPGLAEMVAYAESRVQKPGNGLQKWILAALVVLILVLAMPIYGLWRMKVRAEEQVDRFVTAIENVKNDVAKQGDRLDALYVIVKSTGSDAWNKVQGEFSEWMSADSSGE